MTIVYRLQKGGPLTAAELDDNFRDLHQRLEVLEQSHAKAEVWRGRMDLQGEELIFLSPSADVLSRMRLPLPRLNPRGVWQTKQSYAAYDLVTTGKQVYVCVKAHESSDVFMTDNDRWQMFLDMTA
jgi:heme oxygenase